MGKLVNSKSTKAELLEKTKNQQKELRLIFEQKEEWLRQYTELSGTVSFAIKALRSHCPYTARVYLQEAIGVNHTTDCDATNILREIAEYSEEQGIEP